MATRAKTTAELEAWDIYYAAALNSSFAPGALRSVAGNTLKAALQDAADAADLMLQIRRDREPKA